MTLASARRLVSALAFFCIFTLATPFAPAQSSTQPGDQLSVCVTDPDNAGVPGATVMSIVRDNRLRTTSQASGDVSYRFDRVEAGNYGHCALHLKWRLDV